MATHKVPQDVEADDKLIGPFSFRQIVYLLISAGAGFLAFELGKLALPLAIIPAPVCLFFLIIALPLRKDQPTEIYLAAVVKYFLKPHQRMWVADGEAPLVEISAPVTERPAIKDLNDEEVSRRLSFLTNITDTQGWSTRGYSVPVNNTNLNDDYASDAVNAPDIMEGGALNDAIGQKLAQSDAKVRNNAIREMHAAAEPTPAVDQAATPQPAGQQQAAQQAVQPVQSQTPVAPISSPPVVNSPFAPSRPVMPTASAGYYDPQPTSTDDIPDLQSTTITPQHKSIRPIANNPTITTEAVSQPAVASPAPWPEPTLQATSAPAQQLAGRPTNSQQTTTEPAIIENDEPIIDVKLH